MTFDEAVAIMDYGKQKNPDELRCCVACQSDNIGSLTWMCLGGEPRILKATGVERCMDCGSKDFLPKDGGINNE